MAALLEKLCIEQTKSRSRQTNDNALAERSLPRIPATAPALLYLPPSMAVAYAHDIRASLRSTSMRRRYEKLRPLREAERYLKPETTLRKRDAIAAECSDNGAAQRLNAARTALFQSINKNPTSRRLNDTSPMLSLRLKFGLENTGAME